MTPGPETDPTVLRWLYEHLWIPTVGAGTTLLYLMARYINQTLFARLEAVEQKAASALPRVEYEKEMDRHARNIHDLRDDMQKVVSELHNKIDTMNAAQTARHDEVMRILVNRNNR